MRLDLRVLALASLTATLACADEGNKRTSIVDDDGGMRDADVDPLDGSQGGDEDGSMSMPGLDGSVDSDSGEPVACQGTSGCDDLDPCTINDRCSDDICLGEPKCPGACASGECIDASSVTVPIAAGNGVTCVRSEDGALACWELMLTFPASGKVATGFDLPAKALQVSVWTGHKCVLLDGGAVKCWGAGGGVGKLGYPGIDAVSTPAEAADVDLGAAAVSIAVGANHSCAALADGNVRCWGEGGAKLGYGDGDLLDVGVDETPAQRGVVDVGGDAVAVSVGDKHSCALLETGDLRCWGPALLSGTADSFVYGDDESPSAAPVAALGQKVVQFSAGDQHVCAVLEDHTLRCWGRGTAGRLGYGDTEDVGDDETPEEKGPVDVGGPVTQVSCGFQHTCAVLEDRTVRCWGLGTEGRLGYGNTSTVGDDETPGSLPAAVNVGGDVAYVSAGATHTCAVLTTGDVRCWGDGYRFTHGHNTMDDIGDNESPASAGDVPVW